MHLWYAEENSCRPSFDKAATHFINFIKQITLFQSTHGVAYDEKLEFPASRDALD